MIFLDIPQHSFLLMFRKEISCFQMFPERERPRRVPLLRNQQERRRWGVLEATAEGTMLQGKILEFRITHFLDSK